jgi:DNA-binding MarR family transcriptional regulator
MIEILIMWVSCLSRYFFKEGCSMSRMYTAEDITSATRRLDVARTSLMVAFSRAVGISVSEMIALEHLDASGGLGPSELARRLQMTTGAVTALVDRLEEGGYVARAAHPSDRRRIVISRTQKADDDITEEVAPIVMEILELAESFADVERQAVGRFLDGFIEIIERTAAEACER